MPTDLFVHNLSLNKGSPFGQVSASTEYDGLRQAWAAFNGSTTGMWLANSPTGWLRLQLYWAQHVDSYSIQTGLDFQTFDPGYPTVVTRAPKTWTFEGSNNGSTWTTLDTRSNETAWTFGETRTYNCSVTGTDYLYFRVNITVNNGDGSFVQIGELHIYANTPTVTPADIAPHTMTTNSSVSPFVASASTHQTSPTNWDAFRAFDGVISDTNRWVGNNSGVDWIQLDLGSGYILTAYSVQAYVFDGTQEPKNWTFQGSSNASTWTTLDTETNQTAWATSECRTYLFTNTTAYRYYRLNISANNGSIPYTSVGELYFFGAAGGDITNLVLDSISISDSILISSEGFPNSWVCKCPITIQHGQVTANQTALPALLTEACLPAGMLTLSGSNAAQSDGGDIRFTSDSAGTARLACQIVKWTQNATPSLSLAQIWVPVNVLSASDVTIYVWYNAGGGKVQPSISAAFGAQAVWDSNYKGVYHWDNVSGTSSIGDDSTASPNSFGPYNLTTGKIGGGAPFVAAAVNYAQASDSKLPSGAGAFTIEVWANWTSLTNGILVAYGGGGAAFTAACYIQYSSPTLYGGFFPGLQITFTPTLATWYHIVLSYDGTNLRYYINGVAQTPATATVTMAVSLNVIRCGAATWSSPTFFFDGVLDELRFSSSQRSATWISTSYNNQNSPATFAIAGTSVCGAADVANLVSDSISLSDAAVRTISSSSTQLVSDNIVLSDLMSVITPLGRLSGDLLTILDAVLSELGIILPPPFVPHQFEFYGMDTPEDVEILPVPKKYDQVGPVRFDKIGKIFGFRVRLIASGTTVIMPYKIYGDDSESLDHLNSPLFFDSFTVRPGLDNVYEIQLPKSVNTDICRITFGPVDDPFYRYDVLIKVHTSGMKGQAKWIPIR